MKVAYCMRVDAECKRGGDFFQMQEYIAAGQQKGTGGAPLFEGEIVTDLAGDLSRFDLVHLTNIDRPIEAFVYSRRALAMHKPIVFSSIHHSYSEIEQYEHAGRGGMIGRVSGALSFQQLELLRSLVRSASWPELAAPTLRVALTGLRKAQHRTLQICERILVLSNKERLDIVDDFGPVDPVKFHLLRNGLRQRPSDSAETDLVRSWDVCVVGRIEARKNQIAILKALEKLGLRGVFVGGENKNHKRYCERFKKLVTSSRSEYLGELPYEGVENLMRSAKVHVSASWFEVLSLVDLEARQCGCVVVCSICGGTKEILGDDAVYVDPSVGESIEWGILTALQRANIGTITKAAGPALPSWKQVGVQLAEIYREVVSEYGQRRSRSDLRQ